MSSRNRGKLWRMRKDKGWEVKREVSSRILKVTRDS